MRLVEQGGERRVDVVLRVVDVERRAQRAAAHGREDAGAPQPLLGAREVGRDDRRVAFREAEAGAEAVREREIVLVDRLDADLASTASAGSVPTQENQAGERSSRLASVASWSGGS